MRSLLFALFALPAMTAMAETPMTGAEFEAYVQGRTLSFGTQSNPAFGVEKYLPNREVIWSPRDGSCVDGVWYEQDDTICFLYEHDPEPKCWRTYRSENGIRAEFTNRPGQSVIFESVDEPAELICPGPDLLG